MKAGGGGRYKITGDKELDRALVALDAAVAKVIVRQALRKAMRPVKAAVIQEAPLGETGGIRKNVKIKAAKRSTKSIAVNVIIGKGDYKGDQYYAAMVTYGHFLGKRSLPNRRKVAANDFMAVAFNGSKDQARAIAIEEIRNGIERQTKKR